MSPATIFNLHLVLGYVAWLLCTTIYIWPTLRAMSPANAQRSIAALHSFRFFGLVFILPGVVGHAVACNVSTFACVRRLRNGIAGHLGPLHEKHTSTLLATCRRLQSCGGGGHSR